MPPPDGVARVGTKTLQLPSKGRGAMTVLKTRVPTTGCSSSRLRSRHAEHIHHSARSARAYVVTARASGERWATTPTASQKIIAFASRGQYEKRAAAGAQHRFREEATCSIPVGQRQRGRDAVPKKKNMPYQSTYHRPATIHHLQTSLPQGHLPGRP